ncbi:hypothetical protein PTV76_003189 [Acinetobacter baumannii]|uniref:DUF968 domain-containing protein n=1 Tax=Acinetobacter baumannii TaxID=470 RepID=UPI000707ABFF|nr:hypothetical protein [Acinetobacter baumannii]KQD91946.1 hypothetical protein APD31_10375 [Acinetobacter baumannii]KQD97586.1 hypothetical protein APD32_13410 [Acinetobacter baumannii]MCA4278428.1 hypothetical protein [Acinetobacter baumannii]MDC4840309.1 hypothetical protein [Acinetobacter baumannii]MDH2638471.1 hypothetical protein [Acinetobacter baumannii]
MRSTKRLNEIRALPCVRCGYPHSQAAHSNFSEHGKGKGIKADDKYTIPLCHSCHQWFDQYRGMGLVESKEWFDKMLEKTERMLNIKDGEVF